MANDKEFQRNVPADKGTQNDPHRRDEDARQPGLNTISTSENDEANQNITRTASDNFREDSAGDEKADKRFDE